MDAAVRRVKRGSWVQTFYRYANGVRENNGSLPPARTPLALRLNEENYSQVTLTL